MARNHAQILVSIWSDEDFKALPVEAQHLYFVLLTQPALTLCGVLDYLPRRFAQASYEMTEDDVERAAKHLTDGRFIVIDYDTSELLIRSFIRRDGLLLIPNVSKGMANAYGSVMSALLRDRIEQELVRCRQLWPDLSSWKAIADVNPVLASRIESELENRPKRTRRA